MEQRSSQNKEDMEVPSRLHETASDFHLHLHGVSKTGTDWYFIRSSVMEPIAKHFSDNSTLILENLKTPQTPAIEYYGNVLKYDLKHTVAARDVSDDICAICCASLKAPYYVFNKTYHCGTRESIVEIPKMIKYEAIALHTAPNGTKHIFHAQCLIKLRMHDHGKCPLCNLVIEDPEWLEIMKILIIELDEIYDKIKYSTSHDDYESSMLSLIKWKSGQIKSIDSEIKRLEPSETIGAANQTEYTEDLGNSQQERLTLLTEQQEIVDDYVTFREIRKDIHTKWGFLRKLTGFNTYTKTFPPRSWGGVGTQWSSDLSPPMSTPLLNGLQRLSLALDRSIEEVG